ncbi:hypothetical protein Vadar_001095 [Vaccinium darrowii]|uniref:Uncharacterized protein n=1 Tax=Vaccinium darrowii TaxID=229202 RepID=A0ACB7Z1N8_9ERIC|nr:hypothetical protein Vadar_001095 [Vaccinium darrowii]
MGELEEWAQPNGLLPNVGLVIQVFDLERWLKAEERTADLIACIQPNLPSEQRNNPNLKDTWANQVRDMLKTEEKSENAEFHVKEVQYIQAEVKIIKCLVENIVVDISFNQLGGLCTLCFLEKVDRLINQNHLLKRSIILIKAWCYYESRILGAHHGLISTYALETLVLYIFHVFNNSFTGPLEVLYRFLEFFGIFDWGNFCVSLCGPVRICSLPDVTPEPPQKDNGELQLSKLFRDACSSVYAVLPGGQENQAQPFVSKHFNVIDLLRINNNLGRSVSKGILFKHYLLIELQISSLPDWIMDLEKVQLISTALVNIWETASCAGCCTRNRTVTAEWNPMHILLYIFVALSNFFRIRSAFSFVAKRLARLLDCPKGNLVHEVNQFFMNTWDRHGSGNRPDAPRLDLLPLRLSTPDELRENPKNNSSAKRLSENASGYEIKVAHTLSRNSSQITSTSEATLTQTQKRYNHLNNLRVSDKVVQEVRPNSCTYIDKCQISARPVREGSNIQGRFLFARTHSSPELTEAYSDVSSQRRPNKVAEGGKFQATSGRQDNNRMKNTESDIVVNHSVHSTNNDPSSSSTSYHCDSGLGAMGDEISSVSETQGMQQEEQDLVNRMASSTFHSLNGQVHLLPNFALSHLPLPISPAILASMGAQRNLTGMLPSNIPFIDPSFLNMQFPRGFVSPHLTHYFPGIRLNSNSGDIITPGNEQLGTEFNPEEADHDFWEEQEVGSTGDFELNGGNNEMLQSEDKPHSDSVGFDFVPSSQRLSGSSRTDNRNDSSSYKDNRSDVYMDDRITSSRFSSSAHSSPLRTKSSSESSWDGSSTNVSQSTRVKWGKKIFSLSVPSTSDGKDRNTSEHDPQPEEDERDFYPLLTMDSDTAERRSHLNGHKLAQTSGSDSMIPIAPMFLGHGSRQRVMDNSGAAPLAFYPMGPPVPFLTMFPKYDAPPETGTSNASLTSHFSGKDDMDRSISGQNFDTSEELNTTNSLRGVASVETLNKQKSDILNSDLDSHWQNLQYGRFCQDPRHNGGPLVYPSPVAVPPVYVQGHCPWNGPGRPLSANMTLLSQLMSYGPQIVPVMQSPSLVSNRPPNVYQHYVDKVPRHRSGTGTYIPNPKVPIRDRHPSGTRKGNYNSDRSDNRSDREGNWNANSKSRASGRSHSRSQTENSNSRIDRLTASSYRDDSVPSYQSQNSPLHSNCDQSDPPTAANGMYPLQAMNTNGMSSNGPNVSSMVMLYPFEHNVSYGSPVEQLEFGSLGPVGLSRMNEKSQLSEGSQFRGPFEKQGFLGGSTPWSSPDQPSSPHFQR